MATVQSTPGQWLTGSATQSTRMLRVRLQLLLTVMLVLTNVIGAAIVFGLTFLTTPGGPSGSYLAALAIAFPIYVTAAVIIGASLITVSALRALRWVRAEREPSAAERRTALRLPWRMTLIQSTLWFGAVILFTILAAATQGEAVISTVFAVSIAGIVVSAIAYLLSEFALRPVAARALAGSSADYPLGAGVQRRMIVFWGLGTAAPVLGLVIAAIVALTRDDINITRLSFLILGLAAVILTFGFMVTVLNARAVVAPIRSVGRALAKVGGGDLDVEVQVNDGTELGQLQLGFNSMVDGLREREQLRDLFGRHVGRSVADAATSGGVELGGETRLVSVLMIDLVGSTTYAADRSPAEVVDMLNRFFTVVVEEVDQRRGLVNKFMGDAVLAIFGAPDDLTDHAGAALSAARAIAERLTDELPEIGAGIGVSTGQAVAGNVGHQSRFEYTVIGDAVNSAARLTELAKDVEGHVLVSSVSVSVANSPEQRQWRSHESIVLRGRDEPTATSRLA